MERLPEADRVLRRGIDPLLTDRGGGNVPPPDDHEQGATTMNKQENIIKCMQVHEEYNRLREVAKNKNKIVLRLLSSYPSSTRTWQMRGRRNEAEEAVADFYSTHRCEIEVASKALRTRSSK